MRFAQPRSLNTIKPTLLAHLLPFPVPADPFPTTRCAQIALLAVHAKGRFSAHIRAQLTLIRNPAMGAAHSACFAPVLDRVVLTQRGTSALLAVRAAPVVFANRGPAAFLAA